MNGVELLLSQLCFSMTDGSVGQNGATCWMAGAKWSWSARRGRRHFGVIMEQLEILVRRSAQEQHAHAEDSERSSCEAARSTGTAKRIATTGDGEAPPPKFAKYTVEQLVDVPSPQLHEDFAEVIQLIPRQ